MLAHEALNYLCFVSAMMKIGALGRQDSQSMLHKLQEKASRHTATFGRKQTKKETEMMETGLNERGPSLQESQVARSLLLACGGNSRLQMSLGSNDMEKDSEAQWRDEWYVESGWRRGFCADKASLVSLSTKQRACL
ncbi:unnamed protein product [Sphenostylis stenocarpa]|uniref:Uncharacterized protein n=1 Tax=Sphenostylis stenocarpa TaxID=92480 RepID=A0AA86SD61_9FABA|nr:unnamed protein product [Sphenostylis stenocarpa]